MEKKQFFFKYGLWYPDESNPTLDSLDKNICTKVLEKQKKVGNQSKRTINFPMNILKDPFETACYKRENSVSFLYDIDAFFHQ